MRKLCCNDCNWNISLCTRRALPLANLAGEEISDQEARLFGELALQLIELLTCRACGEVARKRNSDHFVCNCRKLKMEPLELK